MKRTVLDIEEFQQMAPIFKSRAGAWFLKKLYHWTDMNKVNQIHASHCHLRGSAFTTAMLNDPLMDVRYEVHNREVLKQLPQGAFITVSNHPIGSLDGIILIDIFASIRPDFRVMVNEMLAHISAMSDNFISVMPKTNSQQERNSKNANAIRLSFSHLKQGHPMGFFPAGAMSFYDKKQKQVRDLTWTHSIIRLIRKVNAPVFPVYFDCLNSKFFYRLGRISWKLRQLRVPIEAFNKQGQTLHVYLGNPIPPETIKKIHDDTNLARFLYDATYNSK
jgi:putative hemolysin